MKRTRIAAIDVGTTKVCTIMADYNGDSGLRILGVGITESRGMQKGVVVNINDAKQSIRQSVNMAEQIAGYKLESAYVGITGRHINSLNNRGVVAINRSDNLVRPEDLKRVLKVARTVKVPGDQELLHIIPRNYTIDGQEGVKNPVGMHGFRLDVETHIITTALTSVQNLVRCIHGIGIEIDQLVLGPLASAEAVLTDQEKDSGVMLADIGGGTTDIAIFKNNSINYTSILPVAGYQISHDISVGLGISFNLAEEVKKKYGNLMTEQDGYADKMLTLEGHNVPLADLLRIIRLRVEELLRLIVLELPSSEYAKFIPAGLVLTGGTSNLRGIVETGSEITHLPVRVGMPINLYGVWDNLCNPAYATAIGLLLWRLRNENPQSWRVKDSIHWLTSKMARIFS